MWLFSVIKKIIIKNPEQKTFPKPKVWKASNILKQTDHSLLMLKFTLLHKNDYKHHLYNLFCEIKVLNIKKILETVDLE